MKRGRIVPEQIEELCLVSCVPTPSLCILLPNNPSSRGSIKLRFSDDLRDEIANDQGWASCQFSAGLKVRIRRISHMLCCASLRIVKEKQHLISGSGALSSGFLR